MEKKERDSIEITPEMIEGGARTYVTREEEDDPQEIAVKIFRAMILVWDRPRD